MLIFRIRYGASISLGDGDLALLLLPSLGNDDAEDPVLHRRADCVLIDPLGEVE